MNTKRLYLILTAVLAIISGVLLFNLLLNGKADDPVAAVSDGATVVPGTEIPAVEPSAEPSDNTQQAIAMAGGVEMRDPEPIPSSFDPGSGPTGGCVLGYGENGQCLTVVPPSHAMHPDHGDGTDISTFWTCSEVTQHFADGIVVNDAAKNRDRLGLDSNNDGVACGPGDTGN